jgi:DNA-binding response OmpR family regulator
VAAAAGEPADVDPADNDEDRLLRVLIVDDHRATANTLSALVGIWGHEVRYAYDGVTGLALAAAFRPDVLLLDILMPHVSGFEVAMQVRRQNRFQDCFMIAVTGRTDESHRCQCYEAGVDLCLIKPVVPSHLQTLLMLESEYVPLRHIGALQRSAMLNQ